MQQTNNDLRAQGNTAESGTPVRQYSGHSEFPQIECTPCRFRNAIGKYRLRRSDACVACGTCAEVCPYGVHKKKLNKMATPKHYLCIGFECNKSVEACPEQEH